MSAFLAPIVKQRIAYSSDRQLPVVMIGQTAFRLYDLIRRKSNVRVKHGGLIEYFLANGDEAFIVGIGKNSKGKQIVEIELCY